MEGRQLGFGLGLYEVRVRIRIRIRVQRSYVSDQEFNRFRYMARQRYKGEGYMICPSAQA